MKIMRKRNKFAGKLLVFMLTVIILSSFMPVEAEAGAVDTLATIAPGDGEVTLTMTASGGTYAYLIVPDGFVPASNRIHSSELPLLTPITGSATIPATNGEIIYVFVASYNPVIDGSSYEMYEYQTLSATPVAGGGGEKSESKPESAAEPAAEPEPEKQPVNQVEHQNGSVSAPAPSGVYNSASVNGCVITTPLTSLETAVGLTPEQKAEGAVLKYYVCDSRPSKTKTALQKTVSEDGYKLATIINNDLYRLQKGAVVPIRSVDEKIQVSIGIPQKLQKEGRKFFVICFDPQGNKIIMNDCGNDPKSITIDTNIFGLYALCYED